MMWNLCLFFFHVAGFIYGMEMGSSVVNKWSINIGSNKHSKLEVKVSGPYSIDYPNGTPTFEWCVRI